MLRRSGNPWYDESVVRAIQKASPLPPPPEAGEWPFVFKPEDLAVMRDRSALSRSRCCGRGRDGARAGRAAAGSSSPRRGRQASTASRSRSSRRARAASSARRRCARPCSRALEFSGLFSRSIPRRSSRARRARSLSAPPRLPEWRQSGADALLEGRDEATRQRRRTSASGTSRAAARWCRRATAAAPGRAARRAAHRRRRRRGLHGQARRVATPRSPSSRTAAAPRRSP